MFKDTFFLRRALPTLIILVVIYSLLSFINIPINAVALCIALMVVFCLIKVPVAIAIVLAALIGGLHAGLTFQQIINALNDNLLTGSQVGMTYIMVGAFAVALSRSGILEWMAQKISFSLRSQDCSSQPSHLKPIHTKIKGVLFGIFILASLLSQNLIPVHIAFIPVLIPPLLGIMNHLQIDRRVVVCILSCCMSASYLLLPFGFGSIYLNEILISNFNQIGSPLGLAGTTDMATKAMFWPVMGIIAGMLVAIFVSYRKPRLYASSNTSKVYLESSPSLPGASKASHTSTQYRTDNSYQTSNTKTSTITPVAIFFTFIALIITVLCQVFFDSLFIGALIGFMVLSFTGIFKWKEQDDVFTQGVRLMAEIAIIITIASGFAGVLTATGDIEPLVSSTTQLFGDNKSLGVFVMLATGLFITIGFGDSFASVPILAPIYIPLSVALGLSPIATMSMLGTAAALGDAGSPASTITLGATAGLNADGQHDHVKDSVIPAFLHANIGMLLFAFISILYE